MTDSAQAKLVQDLEAVELWLVNSRFPGHEVAAIDAANTITLVKQALSQPIATEVGEVAYGVYLTDGRFMDIASSDKDDAVSMAEIHYKPDQYLIRPLFARPQGVEVKPLEWDKHGEAKGAYAKYTVYESGGGRWNSVCYPHEESHFRLAEGVSESKAKAAANDHHRTALLSALTRKEAP